MKPRSKEISILSLAALCACLIVPCYGQRYDSKEFLAEFEDYLETSSTPLKAVGPTSDNAQHARVPQGVIVDSHIHLWDLPRHGPVQPGAIGDLRASRLQDNSLFPEIPILIELAPFWQYDHLMSHYNQTPGGSKVGMVVLVESLPGISHETGFNLGKQVEGNLWMLEQARLDSKILSVVGLLNITLPPNEFNGAFDQVKGDKNFVGIRVRDYYDANPDQTFKNFRPNVLENLRTMERAGIKTLDVPEGDNHPTSIVALAREFRKINFVVNHYANYQESTHPHSFVVTPAWVAHLALLGAEKNIYVKVGFLTQLGAPTTSAFPWPFKASTDFKGYEPTLDALLNAFGPDRLLWESNWPTSERGGGARHAGFPGDGPAGWREGGVDTIDLQINIVESWLQGKNPSIRNKIMGENAFRIYSPRH